MREMPSNDPFETSLDRLFRAGRPPSPGFTEQALARAQAKEKGAGASVEAWIEAELATFRVEPGPGFTERTRRRIEAEKAPVIRFPIGLFIRTAGAAAAALALLFAIGQSGFESASSGGEPGLLAQAQPVRATPQVDSATATLLMLAETLDSDARWLLESGDNAALLALAQ